jgi:hypothetical protein
MKKYFKKRHSLAGRNVKLYNQSGKLFSGLLKQLNTHMPYDPAITLLPLSQRNENLGT